MENGSMHEVAGVGQGSRLLSSWNRGGDHLPSILKGDLGTSAEKYNPLSSRTFFSTNICLVLMFGLTFATTCIRLISANSSFSVSATGYNCSSNPICLGGAHVYNESTGNSIQDGIQDGYLSLLPEASYQNAIYQLGVAYYRSPVQLTNFSLVQSASFTTSFTINQIFGVVNGSLVTGDGMAFVISGSNSSLGYNESGGYLGIFNAGGATTFKSIVVEFDTYQNDYAPMFDISWSHVSFDFQNITTPAAANTSDVGMEFAYNATTYAWVEYTSETNLLEVSVSYENSRPTNSLLNYTVDLLDVSEEYMWVGFSSGSGASYSNFYIGDWKFESYGLDVPSSPGGIAPSPSITLGPAPSSPGVVVPGGPIPEVGKSGGNKVGVIVGVSAGASVFFLTACILAALFLRRRSRGGWIGSADAMMQIEGMPERFSYKQLSVATRAFSEESKLGQGGFGSVYRGVLPSNGTPVAVKRISGDSSLGERIYF